MKFLISNAVVSFLILTMFSSCFKNILEEKNKSAYPLDAVDGKALIVDAYNKMAEIASDRQWYLMTETASDNCNFIGSNARRRQFMSARVDPGNSELSAIWDILYRGVTSANTVLSKIDSSSVSEQESLRIKGEARFIRAFNLFALVRFFGDVPMPLKPSQPGDPLNQRISAAAVLAQIIEDLKFSENTLPQSYEGQSKGRATLHAARALLGKVYLTRASVAKYNHALNYGGSTKDYDSARIYLLKVVETSDHSLLPNYSDNFNVLTENNSEGVFYIKCLANGAYRNTNRGAADWAANPNLYGGNSYAQTALTKDLYGLFSASDNRLQLIVCGSYTTTQGKTYQTTVYSRNGNTSYGNLIFSWKFLDSQNPAADGGVGEGFQLGGVDYPLIRFADVLLMLAEAKYETGDTDALGVLNRVRKRANTGNLTGISLDEILKERRRELYLEGHRWFDLVRTGTLKLRVEQAAQTEGPLIHYDASVVVDLPKEYVFPIPQREVDLGLPQNTGY
ncbi:RagB/SusD family nutrient uptake outer membrane protein [Niabella aquatica]